MLRMDILKDIRVFLELKSLLRKEQRQRRVPFMMKFTTASIYKHVWKIQNLSKLHSKRYESEIFIAGDQNLDLMLKKIYLYPKGQREGPGSHTSMHLVFG
ncbi:hypothetical protein CICLE_v10003907mg [Citrus x clementina]|uniref:MATH domain-containing protein n=1 Tax=Citrus clementina TaxID=85681 RepID=V4T3M5_CITCL|nr:hypothetical protein CICLE_v10003907mg [Citrus x clementina]